jgi:glycerophosphoryl diester phosphodiesterase
MSTPLGDTLRDFRCCWKQLLVTDLVYKVLAFILLTPILGVLFRGLIALSGNAILTDLDILLFFLGPAGWACLVAVGALWLGITAVELAALMAILASASHKPIRTVHALRFASVNGWRAVRVTGRLVVFTLLAAAPFLAALAAVYFALLTEHDINYYLKEKPPAFWAAVSVAGVIVVSLLALLLRLHSGWFFALPLVLFEGVSPRRALRVSRERAAGHRRTVVLWILGWFLATTALSALVTAGVVWVGSQVVPRSASSLRLLTLVIGASLLLWSAIHLALNLLGTTTFAGVHFHLYRRFGSAGPVDPARLNLVGAAGEDAGFGLTRKRLLAGAVGGVVVAVAVGVLTLQSVRLGDDVVVIAHRGSSKAAPENTMAAVRRAVEDGADWIEIDVQETADGEVVVFHDSDFMKLAGRDLKIWNAAAADLKDIDIGSWFGADFSSERVPTLGEVLDACKGRAGVNIELKYYGHDQQLERRVAEIVEAHGMVDSVIFMSLKPEAVGKMKALRPDWTVGLLLSVSAGNPRRIEADFLAVNAEFASRSFIRSAHRDGKKVYVWTVNDAVTMSTLIGRGVDGVITDRPDLARSVLEQRARMSTPERLLLELAETLGVAPELAEQ